MCSARGQWVGSSLPRKVKSIHNNKLQRRPRVHLSSPFCGHGVFLYSLGLTTTIIVVVGTHVSLGSLVPPKIQVKGQPMALLYAALFGILLRLLVKMRSMFGKPIPTYSMRFPPLRARGSMGTFLNPIITCTRIYYYVSS